MDRWAGGRIFGAVLILCAAMAGCSQTEAGDPAIPLDSFSPSVRSLLVSVSPRRGFDRLRVRGPFEGALRFGTSSLQVHIDALGAATHLEGAGEAYAFARGFAFYRPRGEALEELFLVPAPPAGEPVARWSAEGGRFDRDAASGRVNLLDEASTVVAWITAPWAELPGGLRLRPRLSAQGSKLALFLDGVKAGTWVLVDPIWTAAPVTGLARAEHTATLLPTGEVILVGGIGALGFTASVEVLDPATGAITTTAGLGVARSLHSASVLHDGRLLVVGGRDVGGALASCEASLDAGRTFGACQSLTAPRFGHTATVLRDGRLLITGGYDGAGGELSSAELFDPGTGLWSDAGAMVDARAEHTAVLLPGDGVLLAGGVGPLGELASAETWSAGAFSATGAMSLARARHTATLLYDGRVLLVGGSVAGTPLPGADLYDAATGLFTPTLTAPAARTGHSATLLPDGQVVLSGGRGLAGLEAIAQIFDPSSGAFVTGGALASPREQHSATLLPGGHIEVIGGADATGTILPDIEHFREGTAGWSLAGDLGTPRQAFALLRLGDGHVMAIGGKNDGGGLDTAELFDPVTETWTAAGMLSSVWIDPAAIAVGNDVIVAGGDDGTVSLPTAKRWSAGSWTPLPTMNDARVDHVFVQLDDGGLLAIGGDDGVSAIPELDTTEILYLGSAAWSPRAKLNARRRRARGGKLLDGRVLVAGGKDPNGRVNTAELYDPAGNTWSVTGSMRDVRSDFTLTLLSDGRVLVAGGDDGNAALATCDVFDPATGVWSPTGDLAVARFGHAGALLPDGRVLVTGGEDGATVATLFDSTEIWDPATGLWSTVQPIASVRRRARAVLLSDGRVLLAGGKDDNRPIGSQVLPLTELYDLGSGGPPVWAPTLSAPAATFPGATITLAGLGFTGRSEASGGGTRASAVNLPLVALTAPGGVTTWGVVRSFTDTTLDVQLGAGLATGTYQVAVVVAGSMSASWPLPLDPPPPGPQRIGFLSPPQTLATGACSAPATFELQDAAGIPLADPVKSTAITLNSVPPGVSFASDPSCASPTNSVSVPAGQTLGTFYFSGAVVGPSNLFASATGLATGFQVATFTSGPVGQLAFLTPPRAPSAGICSGPVTVETRDEFGAVKTVASNTPLTLGSTLGGVAFFSGAGCQNGIGTVSAVLSGTSQTTFYFAGSTPGTGNLQVQAAGFQSVGQPISVQAGASVSLVIETPVIQTQVATCAGPVTVALRDVTGNPTVAAADLTLDLGASPSTSLVFSLDASCVVATSTATLATGSGSVDLYFEDTLAGAPTLRATDAAGALGFAEQTETVLAGAPVTLAFGVEPSTVAVAATLAPALEVETLDAFGNRAPVPPASVTLALGQNPGVANLSGTTTVGTLAGVARFSDLALDRAGQGYTLFATAAGLTQAESAPFDVSSTSTALDPASPVRASSSSAEACASQGRFIVLTVEPRTTDGSALAPGRTVTITEDPPYLLQGAVTEIAGAVPRYEIEVGSNRCGGARPVQVLVDGVALVTEPSITFTCPPVQSSGITFAADPAQVPADGLTPAVVLVSVVDRCNNPAFGRAVSLDLTNAALTGASISPANVSTADTPGAAGDGSARFEIVSIDSGSTGVAARVEGVTAVSIGDLVTFALDDVLGVTLGTAKTSVVVGESLDLLLQLESAYAGRLTELVITPTLGRLKILEVIGAEQIADGTLRISSLNPRSTTEVILTVQAQAGTGDGTAQANVAYGTASGSDRKTALSTTLTIGIQTKAGTGCECSSARDEPLAVFPLMALFLGLLSTRRRRQK